MAIEKDVRARLEVERTGDTEAIRETAEDVEQLGDSAREGAGDATTFATAWKSAADQVADVEKRLATNVGGRADSLSRARFELDNYREAVRRAQAQGQVVDPADLERIRQLERRYDRAAETLGRYRAAQSRAREDTRRSTVAAGEQAQSIRGLDDLLRVGTGRWGRYVVSAGAVIGVFGSAFAAGTKVRDVLNDLTDGALDRGIQKWAGFTAATERWVGAAGTAANVAGRLAREQELLRKNGIDPTGLSAEEVSRKVTEMGKAMQAGMHAAAAAQDQQKAYAQGLTETRRELDETAAALLKFVETARDEDSDPLTEEQVDRLKERIKEILKEYARLGVEAPQGIRTLANEWGVLTAAEEQAIARHKELMSEFRDAIAGAADSSPEQLQQQADALVAVFEQLDFTRIKGLRGPAFANVQEQIQELVDKFREAGVLIPEHLAGVADQAEVLVFAYEQLGTKVFQNLKTAGEGTIKLKEETDAAGNRVLRLVQEVDQADSEIDLSEASEEVRGLLGDFEGLGEGVREAADDSKAAGDDIGAAGKKVKEGAAGIEETGEAAGEAGRKLGEAAQGATDLATQTGEAEGQVASLDERLAGIEERLGKTEERISSLATSVGQIGTSFGDAATEAEAGMGRIESGVDRVTAKVDALLSKMAQLQEGGGTDTGGDQVEAA